MKASIQLTLAAILVVAAAGCEQEPEIEAATESERKIISTVQKSTKDTALTAVKNAEESAKVMAEQFAGEVADRVRQAGELLDKMGDQIEANDLQGAQETVGGLVSMKQELPQGLQVQIEAAQATLNAAQKAQRIDLGLPPEAGLEQSGLLETGPATRPSD